MTASTNTDNNMYEGVKNIVRPVMRTKVFDEYLEHFEEADPIAPGAVRLKPSAAPWTTGKHGIFPVKALEEAPDGLRRLDWSGNGLESLPKIPTNCCYARIVKINDNKFPSFPQELSQLLLMQQLRIDGNSITAIPPYIEKFSLLQDLKASDNSISSVSSNLGFCTQLTSIDIQRNQINVLPASLGRCTNLVKLLISSNRITTFPETFSRLCELQVLKAEKNSIVDIGFYIHRLSKLRQLFLGHNMISDLGEDFGKLCALEDFAIQRNKLQVLFPSMLALEKNLKRLRLEDNPLHSPPLEIVYRGCAAIFIFLKRMQFAIYSWDLDLGNLNLKAVPFPLASAQNWEQNCWCRLKHLSIRNNNIVSLPQDVELMTNLTILDISNNHLSTVPPAIAFLTSLRVLDVSCNRVQALPNEMKNNINLEELLLENNLLKGIPPAAFQLLKLTDLRLSGNKLTKVPDHVQDLMFLTYMTLEFNGIFTLPDTLSGLFSIKTLKLNNNKILDLPPSLMKIRPSNQPAVHHLLKKSEDKSRKLGALISPQVRQARITRILYGGNRGNYRSLPQVPFDQRVYEKPSDAGDRRGWDLVRFSLFGPEGPRLKPKPKVVEKEQVHAPVIEEADEQEEEEEEEKDLKPVRKGFVARLRTLFIRKKPQDDAEEQDLSSAGLKKNRKDATSEPTVNAQKTEEANKRNWFFQRNSVTEAAKTENAQKDEVQDDFGAYLQDITELDASYNLLETVPAAIGNLSTLTSLSLQHNRLEKLPRQIASLENLKSFNLAGNLFVELPHQLGRLVSLEKLDLSSQGSGATLNNLPDTIRSLVLLKELRLSNNCFKILPAGILPKDTELGMTSLRVLAMDHNPLMMVDEDIAVHALMERLYLNNTKIKTLNESIIYFYRLKELWIHDTNVRSLDPGISRLPDLRKLVLSHEDQLDNFVDLRRLIKGSVWNFVSPGEGETAELSALAKQRERAEAVAAANRRNSTADDEALVRSASGASQRRSSVRFYNKD